MMKKVIHLTVAAIIGATITANVASAATHHLAATLTCSQEVPLCASCGADAEGRATLVLDTTAHTLTMLIEFSGLGSAESAAHIHGPAAPGVSAGVLFNINAQTGTGSPKMTTWNGLTTQQEEWILSGLTYINIHSADCSPGEIRGQITNPIIISEYYEANGQRKCIELFNTDTINDYDLGANGLFLAMYRDMDFAGMADAPHGTYFFGQVSSSATMNVPSETIPAGETYVICAEDDELNPNFDDVPNVTPDLLLPFDGQDCVTIYGTNCIYNTAVTQTTCTGAFGCSPVNRLAGDDALAVYGPTITTPFDNLVDVFGVPWEQDSGPRGNNPYNDTAWERRFSVVFGVTDLLGFDSCNFDGLRDCNLTTCPPGTPVGGGSPEGMACLNDPPSPNAEQWLFEGLNGFNNNANHSLGVHVDNLPPIAGPTQVITKVDVPLDIPLSVIDVDGDAFDVIIESLPANGTLFDGMTEITAMDLPHPLSDPMNPVVTYTSGAGDATDTSFTYFGKETVSGTEGDPATVTILVQDERVIITEIMFNPNNMVGASDEFQWEWIEIYNPSDSAVDLGELNNTNCPVCDDNLITDPGGANTPLTLDPGEVIVLAADEPDGRPNAEFLSTWGLSAQQVFFVPGELPFLSNAGTQLFLFDDTGDLVDFVPNYGFAPFPNPAPGSSIALQPEPTAGNALGDNDNGENWAESMLGVCGDGTIQVSGPDTGSPAFISGVSTGNVAPCAFGKINYGRAVGGVAELTITLDGTDDSSPVEFIITSLPTIKSGLVGDTGILLDGMTQINSVPHTLSGDEVIYRNNSGRRDFFEFEFNVREADGDMLESPPATEEVVIQGSDLVITEIMANPANATSGDEAFWEYIEVTNVGTTSAFIGSLQAGDEAFIPNANIELTFGGAGDVEIMPGETKIIARDDTEGSSTRTRQAFIDEWFPGGPMGIGLCNDGAVPTADKFIWVPATEWDQVFNNPAGRGQLIAIWDVSFFPVGGTGQLHDAVFFRNGEDGWPGFGSGFSVFHKPVIDSLNNDEGVNWQTTVFFCDGGCVSDPTDEIVDFGTPLAQSVDPTPCVPSPCATCLGDLSGDNKVNGVDISLFIDLATDPMLDFPVVGCADFNGDGDPFDYLPDLPLFVDALLFGSVDCADFVTTRTTTITIEAMGTPANGAEIELFLGGCEDVACGELAVSPPFLCFERVTITESTTAELLALQLAFGADGMADGIGGLEEFCADGGATVDVSQATITVTWVRPAGATIPCCYVQDTDGTFSNMAPFDFHLLGGDADCVVSNLANGVAGDETAAFASGFRFSKSE